MHYSNVNIFYSSPTFIIIHISKRDLYYNDFSAGTLDEANMAPKEEEKKLFHHRWLVAMKVV